MDDMLSLLAAEMTELAKQVLLERQREAITRAWRASFRFDLAACNLKSRC